jgi:anti-sigma factor RsiW
MNSNFDAHNCSGQEAARDMDSLQRDRFELISAYIDGEVTAAERYQVQDWLANDANSQHLYTRLMKLRQGLHQLPVPATQVTAQETANQVFTRIDRRRLRNTMVWGGAAIAAMFVSAFSGILPGSQLMPRLAQTPVTEEAAEPLMIAVNRPVIQIPKATSASPENFVDSAIFNP